MNKYRIFAITAVASMLVIAAFSYWGTDFAAGNAARAYLDTAQLDSLNVTSPGTTLSGSTIYVNSTANMLIMMGDMDTGDMYSFQIFGAVNPQIVVAQGTAIHFIVVNADTDASHNMVLTRTSPPYSYMPGQTMMSNGGFMTMMPYIAPMSSGHYSYYNFTYTFTEAGNYWYLCSYPGHANSGMYGNIVVT